MIRWGFEGQERERMQAELEKVCQTMPHHLDPSGVMKAGVDFLELLIEHDEIEIAWLINAVMVFRQNEVHGDLLPLVNQIATAHNIAN